MVFYSTIFQCCSFSRFWSRDPNVLLVARGTDPFFFLFFFFFSFFFFFFTLCCRRALCGCCCRCAPWFQSYPAWETLFHFLPSAVASCRGKEEKQEDVRFLGGVCFFPAGWWQEHKVHIQLMWTGTDWSVTTQRMLLYEAGTYSKCLLN